MKGLKKALGQNFFNNPNLADKIVNFVLESKPEKVIEIGPGDGYFTKRIANLTPNLSLIEKDSLLAQDLAVKFPKLNIINEDFLEVNISELNISQNTVIFGSLPYNVSKHIITRLLEEAENNKMYFIVQKEVAQKYVDSTETSIQYLTTKLFADTKILQYINPGSFIPAPKVDSAFIVMTRNNKSQNINCKDFIKFIKVAFLSPRKTLRNNLKGYIFQIDQTLFLNKRPSQLSFEEFKSLFLSLK